MCHKALEQTTPKTMSERTSTAGEPSVSATEQRGSGNPSPRIENEAAVENEHPEKMFTESIQERYSVGRLLGEGAFSIVRKAKRRKDGFICALKIIDKKEDSEEAVDLKSEIEILCKVDHPHCVAFYEWTEVRT